jgi:PAS domain S-box-containing protein
MRQLRLTTWMLVVALLIGGAFALATAFGLRLLAHRIATQQLVSVGEGLARPLSWAIGRMLESGDVRRAQRMVEFATTTPEVQEVIVTSRDGMVVAASRRSLVGTRFVDAELDSSLALRVPVIVTADGLSIPAEPTHTLTVILHPAALSRTTVSLTLLLGLFALGILGSSLAAVLVATHRVVLRPLQQVVAAATRVAAGDQGTRVRVSGPREITTLADNFNRMLDAILEQQAHLQASELRYRTLFEHLPMPMHVIDESSTIVEYNEAFAAALGWGRDQLLGHPLRQVLPSDIDRAVEEELLASPRDVHFGDARYQRRDGSVLLARQRAVRLRAPDGSGQQVHVAWIDVSREERQARADALLHHTLAVGAEAGRSLGDKLHTMIALLRQTFAAERAFLATTEAHARGFGHMVARAVEFGFPALDQSQETVPAEAIAHQLQELRRVGGVAFLVQPYDNVGTPGPEYFSGLQIRASAVTLCRANTQADPWLIGLDFVRHVPVWSGAESKLMQDFGQAVAMVIESEINVEALEQAKLEVETVFEAQLDGVAMVDSLGMVVRSNRAYRDLLRPLGSEPQVDWTCRCSGCPCADEQACAINQALAIGKGQATFLKEIDGAQRWIECSVHRVVGSPNLLTHVVRDISEQRILSDRATRQARLESLGTLAGGVAHEFNNILMGMVPAVERLRRATSSDPAAVELIAGAVERGGQLTRRMLALSRHQAGFVGRAHLGQTLQDVIAVLASSLPKNIILQMDFDRDLGWVGLEPSALHSVLLNLATNSRDAMPEGGILRFAGHVEERDGGSWAVVTVSDTGVGIAPEDLPNIFDPFFTTKIKGRGTGLGLPLVHRLVSEARGTITGTSAGHDQGASFAVELPMVAQIQPSSFAPPTERNALRGRTIMMVDDERLIREGVAGLLREAGAAVEECSSAEQALTLFAADPDRFDAVVADFGLPGKDGCVLLAEMLETRPQLIAALASGYTETARFDTLQSRGVHFFQKPYRVSDLIHSLASRLTSTSS